MSITEATKNRLIEYILDRGHTVIDHDTLIKKGEWIIQCSKCDEPNCVKVHTLTTMLNSLSDLKCKSCKFQKKLDKFLERCHFSLVEGSQVDMDYAHLCCNKCNLCYEYNGDFQDNYRCYCSLSVKRSEHVLYRRLVTHFRDYPDEHFAMSKEVKIFGNHKVDMRLQIGEKEFLFEVDDPGHFNPRNTQGMRDIECVREFLQDQVENLYLIHINEDDVFVEESIEKLFNWVDQTLQDEPEEKLVLVDSSGKNRYKYLKLDDTGKYLI